jgi:hypothetical protein
MKALNKVLALGALAVSGCVTEGYYVESYTPPVVQTVYVSPYPRNVIYTQPVFVREVQPIYYPQTSHHHPIIHPPRPPANYLAPPARHHEIPRVRPSFVNPTNPRPRERF